MLQTKESDNCRGHVIKFGMDMAMDLDIDLVWLSLLGNVSAVVATLCIHACFLKFSEATNRRAILAADVGGDATDGTTHGSAAKLRRAVQGTLRTYGFFNMLSFTAVVPESYGLVRQIYPRHAAVFSGQLDGFA